ncbi:hypothetical protein A4R44_07952 [Amycolatopsis sp. M39]|nr:hypothetical protein A4R44_07952 [Amycolatopsis sp. M39]
MSDINEALHLRTMRMAQPRKPKPKIFPSKKTAKKAAKRDAATAKGAAGTGGTCSAKNHVHCDYYKNAKDRRRGYRNRRTHTTHYYW